MTEQVRYASPGRDFGQGVQPVKMTALISDDGLYRYRLTRTWDDDLPVCGWVMLNPSTADALLDDPTIRRCRSFAAQWGYGGIVVANVYALRATDPRELARARDPIGPENRGHLERVAGECPIVVCAWGSRVDRDLSWRTRGILADAGGRLRRVGPPTKSGQPRHPLYLAGSSKLEEYAR